MNDFVKIPSKSGVSQPWLLTSPNSTNFNFEREDWTLFRTVQGLQQKAGVERHLLRRLVLKELADNGLDTGAQVDVGKVGEHGFFISDTGPGIDGSPEDIARLFSVRRPMLSSKLLRLPTRGALGNGLRVVAGAVLASSGRLTVTTRNQLIELRPEGDGTTTAVTTTAASHPVGTRVEITFGPDLPVDLHALDWAEEACWLAGIGETYSGKSSPFWYDSEQFHELLYASGMRPVRELLGRLDGCSGAKAGNIVTEAGLDRMACSNVNRQQATQLLNVARTHARAVKPERLGLIGEDAYFVDHYHAIERGVVTLKGSPPRCELPFVVEAWAEKSVGDDIDLSVLVNRTPVTGIINAYRSISNKTSIFAGGCGLRDYIATGIPAKGAYDVRLNVTTPYCPITSDGKAPDLSPFVEKIKEAVTRAMMRAHRAAPKEKRKDAQKDVVLDNLADAVAKASGNGMYAFNERQVFYVIRDRVMELTGKELNAKYFSGIITDYENENGEIKGMYREPRGSLMHPHNGGAIPLGTLTVRDYERPIWMFNKILYIEKEGFTQALETVRWPDRHDCAIMSSKGYTTRAARDLVDKLVEHDEPVTVFCVHDADAYGTMIYQTFQEETKARGARKVQIINLGLEPWEAVNMGLSVEPVEAKEKHKAVAVYVQERGESWLEWLQTHRVELNAMTMPQFIAWLDAKMAKHGDGKLIPPANVLTEDLDGRIESKVRQAVRERILREARFDEQVAAAEATIKRPPALDLVKGIKHLFDEQQEKSWRDHIEAVATDLVRQIR